MWAKTKEFLKNIYKKLLQTKASPQKVALGFALGVFIGIYPGTGPVFALVLAWIFRLPKAAAFLGGLLTNTWLSWVTLVIAGQIGAAVLGLEWNDIKEPITDFMSDFHWKKLIDGSVWETVGPILKPLLIGYAVVGLAAGVLSYFIVLYILKKRSARRRA